MILKTCALVMLSLTPVASAPVITPPAHTVSPTPHYNVTPCWYTVVGSAHRLVSVAVDSPPRGLVVRVQVTQGGATWLIQRAMPRDGVLNVRAPFGGAGSHHVVQVIDRHGDATRCGRDDAGRS